MYNSSDISPQKQDLLKAMDDNMNENSIDIDVSAGDANANIRTEWDAATAIQHEGDTSLQSTADIEAMQTEGYNAQVEQVVADSIQSNVQANPESVKAALANGMGILLYLEVRLQSDSGNINYAGFKADATSNAYVDFITKRGSMEAAAQAMAGDISSAIATGQLSAAEVSQLQGVLTGLIGDADLSEAYVEANLPSIEIKNEDAGVALQGYVDSKKGVGDNIISKVSGNTINGIQIINGKVGGKIPIDEYVALRQSSIKNPDADSMTLGRFTNGPDSYIAKAGNDSLYFDMGNEWGIVQKKYDMTDAEMFEYFNKPALNNAIARGKTIRFSHDPRAYDKGFLVDEWEHIKKIFTVRDNNLMKIGDFWYVQ